MVANHPDSVWHCVSHCQEGLGRWPDGFTVPVSLRKDMLWGKQFPSGLSVVALEEVRFRVSIPSRVGSASEPELSLG